LRFRSVHRCTQIHEPEPNLAKVHELLKPTTRSPKPHAKTANSIDSAPKAVDGSISSKSDRWYAPGDDDKWIYVDLGKEYSISRWVVKHAGSAGEPMAYNTRAFKLQKSDDAKNWMDVDVVNYSIENITDRSVHPFNARYIRLYISKPSQSAQKAAIIYEFEVYGDELAQDESTVSPIEEISTNDSSLISNDKTPIDESPSTGDKKIFLVFTALILLALVTVLLIKGKIFLARQK